MPDSQTETKKCPECLSAQNLRAKYCSECAYSFFNSVENENQKSERFSILSYLTVSTILRILTAIVLINSVLPQTYEYYYFLKLSVCFTAAYSIYVIIITKKYAFLVPAIFLLILFNPLYSPPIKRNLWVFIDIGVGICLLISIFFLGEKLNLNKVNSIK